VNEDEIKITKREMMKKGKNKIRKNKNMKS